MFAYIKAFIAGFIAVLAFHQGLLWLFDHFDVMTASAWNLAPVGPFGVPIVVSLAFWGALWGLVLWLLIRRAESAGYYVGAAILGAILPTLLAFSLVPLAKGMSVDSLLASLTLPRIGLAMALNGAYGLGFALLMRVMHPPR